VRPNQTDEQLHLCELKAEQTFEAVIDGSKLTLRSRPVGSESEEQSAAEEGLEEEEFEGEPLETVAGEERRAAEAEISLDENLRERFGEARRRGSARHRCRRRRRDGPRSDGCWSIGTDSRRIADEAGRLNATP
jgi:hypothetical protein